MTQPSSSQFESLTRPTWTARRDCNVPICWPQDERLVQRCQTDGPFGGDQARLVPSKWIKMNQLCRNDRNYKTTYTVHSVHLGMEQFFHVSTRDLQTTLRAAGKSARLPELAECCPARRNLCPRNMFARWISPDDPIKLLHNYVLSSMLSPNILQHRPSFSRPGTKGYCGNSGKKMSTLCQIQGTL